MQNVLLPFGIIILIGVVFRRVKLTGVDAETLRSAINSVVLNVFMPALCIKVLYSARIGIETALVPAAAWITTLASLFFSTALFSLLAKPMALTSQERGVLILAASFGNVTYLGLPVLTEVFGQEAAKYALLYDLLATSPIVWTFGVSVAARYGEGGSVTIKDSLRTVLSLPPIWGIVTGLVIKAAHIPLPGFLMKAVGLLGDLVIPLMIFTLGLSLSLRKVAHAVKILPAVAVKFLVVPAIAYATARLLGLEGIAFASCFLEGAMPSMIMTILLAERFRLDVPLAAFTVVVTTALSFVTLPIAFQVLSVVVP